MGIQLPDIEFKVAANTAQMDVAAAKAEILGNAIDRNLKPAGQAFVTFGEKGELASTRISSATAKTRVDLEALEARTRAWAAETGKDFEAGTRAVLKLGDDGEVAVARLSRAVDGLGDHLDKGSGSLFDFGRAGIQPMNMLIGLGVALGLVLTPLAAYTAGLAAALTVGSLVVGGLGILGVGVVALAEHYGNWAEASKTLSTAQTNLTKATDAHNVAVRRLQEGEAALQGTRKPTEAQLLHIQDLQANVTKTAKDMAEAQEAVNDALKGAQNPLTTIEGDLDKMAKALGEQAVPAATTLLNWLDSLIPAVQRLGSELITWFNDRLPQAIPLASRLFDELIAALEQLGARVGPIFDEVLKHPEGFEKAVKDAFGGVINFTGFLLDKLGDLTKWWEAHGPELEAAAQKSMQIIGDATLGLISILGTLALKFNDAEKAADSYGGTLINKLAPATDDATTRQQHLNSVLDGVGRALGAFGEIMTTPLRVLGDMAQSVAGLAGRILNLTDKLGGAGSTASALGGIFNFLLGEIEALVERGFRAALGPLFGVIEGIEAATRAVEALIGGIQRLISWIQAIPGHKTVQVDVQTGGGGGGGGGFAAGGVIMPGRVGRVGEEGEESAYALPGGGVVITPIGGRGTSSDASSIQHNYNLTLHGAGAVNDPEGVRRMLQRMSALGVTA